MRFSQVDVFTSTPLLGNPVAVVHDADDLSDAQMAAFARWTNLSETTFLLSPSDPAADYRLRIFTPGGELPFAGHPTLGSAHAWLAAGAAPKGGDLMQECGAGLVTIRRGERLAFAAPDRLRDGPVEEELLHEIAAAIDIAPGDVVDARWCDNGPGWVGLRLASADAVLDVRPDFAALPVEVGLIGPYPEGSECAVEVRALCRPALGLSEDPVTGSLNAALAQWLTTDGTLPASYVASQGAVVHRSGRVHIETDDAGVIWVGGDTITVIDGTVGLAS